MKNSSPLCNGNLLQSSNPFTYSLPQIESCANFGNAKSFIPDDPIFSPPPDFQTFRRLSLVGSSSSFQCSGQLIQIVYVLHTTLLAAQCISFQIQPYNKKYVYCWCFNIKIILNVIICNEVVMIFVLTTYFKE